MRRFAALFLFVLSTVAAGAAGTGGRVIKVLPFCLDRQGHVAISPSLFDRDAYQAQLRAHPDQVSGLRFDVLWKSWDAGGAALTLRADLRGVTPSGLPREATLQKTISPGHFRRWSFLSLRGTRYKNLGNLVAWRVTLWQGGKLLAQQKSFLWQ
ncbi:MAG: hypothetical protein KGR98_04965 [Verrucomicrobia bacterium]|nr:hypothetical protein [Verrucomicrobiota bacterium]MDE3099429.1 hypothetical protein [Verrucomicrobiota bacterium]